MFCVCVRLCVLVPLFWLFMCTRRLTCGRVCTGRVFCVCVCVCSSVCFGGLSLVVCVCLGRGVSCVLCVCSSVCFDHLLCCLFVCVYS